MHTRTCATICTYMYTHECTFSSKNKDGNISVHRAHIHTAEEEGKVHSPCKTDQHLFIDTVVPFGKVDLTYTIYSLMQPLGSISLHKWKRYDRKQPTH